MGGTLSSLDNNDFSNMTTAQTVGMVAGIATAAVLGAAAGLAISAGAATAGSALVISSLVTMGASALVEAAVASALAHFFPQTGDPGGSGGADDLVQDNPFHNPPTSPLVIDLDGDGIELTALDGSNTYFDLNVDGFAERTGWVNPDDGLLALDVNGNGRIDDNSELFGNATGFNDGFAQLAQLDSNGDGVIDASDAAYGDLRIWRDLDQDGVSDEGELQGLSDVGIASIDLSATEVSETNLEHLVSHRSSVTFSDGTTGLIEDIHFQNDLSSSIALLPDDFEYHPEALAMPVLFGYGKITSTWVSLSADEGLRAQAADLLGHLANADINAFMDGFEGFVQDWAGVADVDPASRGPNVDARKLAFLEKAYGTTFIDQYGGSDPRPNAGRELGEFYDDLVQKLAGRFMAQSASSSAFLSSETFDEFFTAFNDHPLSALAGLLADYSPQTRALNGNLAQVVSDLNQSINAGKISAVNAFAALSLLQADLSDSPENYRQMLEGAAAEAGLDITSEFSFHIRYGHSHDPIIGTSAADNLIAESAAYSLM